MVPADFCPFESGHGKKQEKKPEKTKKRLEKPASAIKSI